jgi:hypothetical protein
MVRYLRPCAPAAIQPGGTARVHGLRGTQARMQPMSDAGQRGCQASGLSVFPRGPDRGQVPSSTPYGRRRPSALTLSMCARITRSRLGVMSWPRDVSPSSSSHDKGDIRNQACPLPSLGVALLVWVAPSPAELALDLSAWT